MTSQASARCPKPYEHGRGLPAGPKQAVRWERLEYWQNPEGRRSDPRSRMEPYPGQVGTYP